MLDEEAAEDGPGGGADRGDGCPDADGGGTLPPVGKDRPEDGERGGHDHGAADTEEHPGPDEDRGFGGERGDRRGDAEERVPEEEDSAPSDPVAESAEEDEERGTDQGVGVDDPEQRGGAGAQVLGERGDRDMKDGRVEGDDEKADAEDDENDPAVGSAAGGGRRSRWGRVRPRHVRTSQ